MPVNPKLLIYSSPPSLFGKYKFRVFVFVLNMSVSPFRFHR